MTPCPLGFRILGGFSEDRRLVDANAALRAHASCDARAEVGRESYLSAFCFDAQFRAFLESTGSVKDFDGICWTPWLWFDLDRENDLPRALSDGRRLAAQL